MYQASSVSSATTPSMSPRVNAAAERAARLRSPRPSGQRRVSRSGGRELGPHRAPRPAASALFAETSLHVQHAATSADRSRARHAAAAPSAAAAAGASRRRRPGVIVSWVSYAHPWPVRRPASRRPGHPGKALANWFSPAGRLGGVNGGGPGSGAAAASARNAFRQRLGGDAAQPGAQGGPLILGSPRQAASSVSPASRPRHRPASPGSGSSQLKLAPVRVRELLECP